MRRAIAFLGLVTAAFVAQAGDGPSGAPPSHEDPLLTYVSTYAPIDAEVRRRVLDVAAQEDAAAAEKKLVAMGEPARRVLLSLAASRPKLEKRAAAVQERHGPVYAEVLRRGLDHDVGWLAAAGTAGAERLDAILPKEAPRKDAVAWWALHGRKYRWDPTGDRFVEAAAPAPSLRLRDRATVRLTDTANLVSPGSPFTIELWWRSADTATEIYLAGDEGWPENSTEKARFETKAGWVLRRIPAGKGAAYLQFCAAVAPNHWWAVSSLPMPASQQWEHLAVVSTGDAVRIFRDGECVAAGRTEDRKFLPSPVDLSIGPRENSQDGQAWARRVGHHEVRGVRISEGARYKDDFTPPASFEKDGSALVLLDLARGEEGLRDQSGHNHHGVNLGGRATAPLDLADVRSAMKALGATLGPATVIEAERGAASTDWWVSERDWMSDGYIHEIWSDRDADALGHWVKVPFAVEKAGAYRIWLLGGSLERHVAEEPYDYSPFSWRIDDGTARRVAGGVPTVSGTRIERGLSVLGTVDLGAGEHVFDLRLLSRRATDNHWSFWFDALVIERLE